MASFVLSNSNSNSNSNRHDSVYGAIIMAEARFTAIARLYRRVHKLKYLISEFHSDLYS